MQTKGEYWVHSYYCIDSLAQICSKLRKCICTDARFVSSRKWHKAPSYFGSTWSGSYRELLGTEQVERAPFGPIRGTCLSHRCIAYCSIADARLFGDRTP